MRRPAPVALAALGLLLTAPAALAHDPPVGDDPLVALLLDRVLDLLPAWLILGAPLMLVGLGLGLYWWARRWVEFADEAE